MEALYGAVHLVKALAHPTRLRIVGLLRQGPLPVCQITSILHAVASTVSGHLNDLRQGGLVTEHRRGKFVYYALSDAPATDAILDAIFRTLGDDAQLREDAALGESIRAMSPFFVCDGSPLCPDRKDSARGAKPVGRSSIMTWKQEWKWATLLLGGFLAVFYLPVGSARFDGAVLESFHLVKWYAREHVLLCLVPALFIAGAISVFVSQASVMKYPRRLGEQGARLRGGLRVRRGPRGVLLHRAAALRGHLQARRGAGTGDRVPVPGPRSTCWPSFSPRACSGSRWASRARSARSRSAS